MYKYEKVREKCVNIHTFLESGSGPTGCFANHELCVYWMFTHTWRWKECVEESKDKS